MKKYDLIVWDWDGTLADSTGMIARALMKAAEEVGLPKLTEQNARNVIGLGLQEAIRHLYGNLSQDQAQALSRRYTFHYFANEEGVPLFVGATALIAELWRRGYKQAIATGKGRRGLDLALQHTGVAKYFKETRTVDECFSKPHPQMLDELMDALVVTPERTLMVGDSTYDLQMAKNAGVDSLAVTFGAHSSEQLLKYHPTGIFKTFHDLSEWLLNNA